MKQEATLSFAAEGRLSASQLEGRDFALRELVEKERHPFVNCRAVFIIIS